MAGEPPKPQSWWQTLPGVLTAVAGIITAATGLIVALNQAHVFPLREKTAPSTPTPTAISSDDKPAKPPTDVATSVNELELYSDYDGSTHEGNRSSGHDRRLLYKAGRRNELHLRRWQIEFGESQRGDGQGAK